MRGVSYEIVCLVLSFIYIAINYCARLTDDWANLEVCLTQPRTLATSILRHIRYIAPTRCAVNASGVRGAESHAVTIINGSACINRMYDGSYWPRPVRLWLPYATFQRTCMYAYYLQPRTLFRPIRVVNIPSHLSPTYRI